MNAFTQSSHPPEPLLELQDLSISFPRHQAVDHLNLAVYPGERLALVGESGSGKTVTALSILRLLAQARITGAIRFQGRDLASLPEDSLRSIRGGEIAMIFQEPMTALNPLYSIGNQIIESLQLHEGLSGAAARDKAIELLKHTGIREPERRVDSFAHQLSGGQRQRAMIAMALACRPKLLIADEPTTALDTTVRARIVKLLRDLQEEDAQRQREAGNGSSAGMAVLLITHDLNLVRKFAQRVAVMERGRLVEVGTVEEVFGNPQHPYTRKLINSIPVRDIKQVPAHASILLETQKLRVEYPKRADSWRQYFKRIPFVALQSADIVLREGETIGIVGESGSGKTTLAQAILNLVQPQSGRIVFEGESVHDRNRAQRLALRSRLQVVFQDPFGSLSPRLTIERIVGEGLELHFPELNAEQRRERVINVLAEVGIPVSALIAYPHQFSGGQRQRIAIARAIVLNPKVLILDEPTSALDVSIQKQVLQLLLRLQQKFNLSYLLISHDLSVVRALAHRIYVLRDGAIVESGDTESVIAQPQHDYTQRLVSASI